MMTAGKSKEYRRRETRRIVIAVAIILYTAALAGQPILRVLGINLGAFGFAGGLIVAWMGFEMIGGHNSKAQGGDFTGKESEEEESLVVPFAMPFVAGPGAITTVIAISTIQGGKTGIYLALIAVTVAVVLLPIGLIFFSRINIKKQTMDLFTRFGGLIVATIGIQLMFNGIKTFYNL